MHKPDPAITLDQLIQSVRHQALRALKKCEPPYGGGPEAANELVNRIIDSYFETGEYEHQRHLLRHCPSEFRQAFYRICRYDPRLSTRPQAKAFLQLYRLVERVPEYMPTYRRFYIESLVRRSRVDLAALWHRTNWYFKVERKTVSSIPETNLEGFLAPGALCRLVAEYFVLTNPDMPNVFRLRKLRYSGKSKMLSDDELFSEEHQTKTTPSSVRKTINHGI